MIWKHNYLCYCKITQYVKNIYCWMVYIVSMWNNPYNDLSLPALQISQQNHRISRGFEVVVEDLSFHLKPDAALRETKDFKQTSKITQGIFVKKAKFLLSGSITGVIWVHQATSKWKYFLGLNSSLFSILFIGCS